MMFYETEELRRLGSYWINTDRMSKRFLDKNTAIFYQHSDDIWMVEFTLKFTFMAKTGNVTRSFPNFGNKFERNLLTIFV